jgi:NAD-dependent SIR2 family protein deacetylase
VIRVCKVCAEEYDDSSAEKEAAGGLITHCPDCSEEPVIRYVGLQAADGKQSQVTIMQFDSETDKRQYMKFWQNNSGYNKGKSCQLGTHLSTTPGVKFKTVSGFNPTNHKGKAA